MGLHLPPIPHPIQIQILEFLPISKQFHAHQLRPHQGHQNVHPHRPQVPAQLRDLGGGHQLLESEPRVQVTEDRSPRHEGEG